MFEDTRHKIMDAAAAAGRARQVRDGGGAVVFTNGCFDLLHAGHVRYLGQARGLGDFLVVGLNSDASVRLLGKGPGRPINPEQQRAEVLSGLEAVSAVVLFDDDTPAQLIETVAPDILAKGGDWPVEKIVGAKWVMARGGKALSIPLVPHLSTTAIEQRLKGSGS